MERLAKMTDSNNPEGYVTQAELDQQFADEKRKAKNMSPYKKEKCPLCGAEINKNNIKVIITSKFNFKGIFTCEKCRHYISVGTFHNKDRATKSIYTIVHFFNKGNNNV